MADTKKAVQAAKKSRDAKKGDGGGGRRHDSDFDRVLAGPHFWISVETKDGRTVRIPVSGRRGGKGKRKARKATTRPFPGTKGRDVEYRAPGATKPSVKAAGRGTPERRAEASRLRERRTALFSEARRARERARANEQQTGRLYSAQDKAEAPNFRIQAKMFEEAARRKSSTFAARKAVKQARGEADEHNARQNQIWGKHQSKNWRASPATHIGSVDSRFMAAQRTLKDIDAKAGQKYRWAHADKGDRSGAVFHAKKALAESRAQRAARATPAKPAGPTPRDARYDRLITRVNKDGTRGTRATEWMPVNEATYRGPSGGMVDRGDLARRRKGVAEAIKARRASRPTKAETPAAPKPAAGQGSLAFGPTLREQAAAKRASKGDAAARKTAIIGKIKARTKRFESEAMAVATQKGLRGDKKKAAMARALEMARRARNAEKLARRATYAGL
jgi:hypothetical protein